MCTDNVCIVGVWYSQTAEMIDSRFFGGLSCFSVVESFVNEKQNAAQWYKQTANFKTLKGYCGIFEAGPHFQPTQSYFC